MLGADVSVGAGVNGGVLVDGCAGACVGCAPAAVALSTLVECVKRLVLDPCEEPGAGGEAVSLVI